MKSRITWKTLKSLAKQVFAPVGEDKPPDHKPYWRMVAGAPDLCCDQHRFFLSRPFPRDPRD